VFEWACGFVGGLLLAAEDHDDASGGIEFDDHVRAFVGDPDVVVPVDTDGVSVGPGVEIAADLAEVGAVGGELEELGGGGSVGWAGGVAAGEDEDVAPGVDGYAGGFAEIEVGREFEEVGDGVEGDFGDGLAVSEGYGQAQRKDKGKAFHNDLLRGDAALLL
jgi:hypothetical protein